MKTFVRVMPGVLSQCVTLEFKGKVHKVEKITCNILRNKQTNNKIPTNSVKALLPLKGEKLVAEWL